MLAHEFGPFRDRLWLNAAHQGPLPRAAARAARKAIRAKVAPHLIEDRDFRRVPRRLRRCLGDLIHVPEEEIILANSASYGLHLLANGMPLCAGDEVLLMEGDFPSNILPWLAHQERGVVVRRIVPGDVVLEPEEVERSITDRTRVLCISWVHSFSGWALDVERIGEICKSRGVWLLVNASQAAGAREIDTTPVDALVSVGFKWLCGPYGTGFCWIRPELLQALQVNRAYWLSMLEGDDLSSESSFAIDGNGAVHYSIFGTANFFNYEPWTRSIELLLQTGIRTVERHDQRLVDRLLTGLAGASYEIISPMRSPRRSTLVVFSHVDEARNQAILNELHDRGIDVSLRGGHLRVAPHIYNTDSDIDRVLDVLVGWEPARR